MGVKIPIDLIYTVNLEIIPAHCFSHQMDNLSVYPMVIKNVFMDKINLSNLLSGVNAKTFYRAFVNGTSASLSLRLYFICNLRI
jgi:hypothetical protein